MDLNKNLKLDHIMDAASLNVSIRHLKLNRSLDEKDKLIDELLIKRLERLRDSLIEYALKGLTIKQDENAKNVG